MDAVSLEILKKADQPNKIRLKLLFEEQIPKINGAWWRGIKEGEFAFYVFLSELQKIGIIIARLDNEDAEYDEILVSSHRLTAQQGIISAVTLYHFDLTISLVEQFGMTSHR